MKRSLIGAAAALLAMLVASLPGSARGQFPELLRRLPSEANTLVVLNAEKIFSSPLAVKEGWKQEYEKSFAAAPLLLPPSAQQFVLASKLGLEFMHPQWEVAVMQLSKDPTVDEIAKKIKGHVDRIGGAEAVEGPHGGFIVKFAPRTFGMISKTDRQNAARWVQKAKASREVSLSPYLTKAAGYAENVGTEIIMALDLQDVVRVADVRAAMDHSPVLKDKKIDLDELSAVLGSIQGATLGVVIREKAFGKLKVDFDRDTAILSGFAKDLLLEMLGEAGATIDEFDDWKEQVRGKQIAIEGYLETTGLRRLFSILEMDTSKVVDTTAPDQEKTAPPADGKETMAYTSKQYFQAVTKYFRDLRMRKGAKSIGQYGLWFQNYARKIDKLPILNVDPELVDYGQNMVNGLRDAVTAIQGIGIRSGARQAQSYPEGYARADYTGYGPMARVGGYGGWRMYGGYSGYAEAYFRNVQGERRAIRAEERAKGASSARDIMKKIDMQTSDMRRKMTERYQIEF